MTGNYDIALGKGTLTIAHNTSLAPDRIDAVKIKKSYVTGNTVNVDDITVTDIASRAIINRKTFYNNYRGVYELVDELENEVIRTFDTAMQEIDFVENPYAVFMKLTEIINSDMDFYGALLRSSRNAGLTHKIRLMLQQKAQERFESRIDLPPERISVMMDYAVSGMVAVYQSWFNSERRQSIEEISDIASRMCLTGLRGAAADARLKE